MHGHTYRIRIEVEGEIEGASGWVMDYAEIKAIWGPIKDQLDHRCMNDVLQNPTCELLLLWIAERLPMAHQIELRETANCGAVWVTCEKKGKGSS